MGTKHKPKSQFVQTMATMEIIKELEPQPRGVYCGTIGLLLPNGRRIFNVAIRTIQLYQGKWRIAAST